ncbi:MAG: PH domain-containing protein [Micromonosporaceae bacterium]|nr:PH domain-containing protein [Micromonosporaceae bacterium]
MSTDGSPTPPDPDRPRGSSEPGGPERDEFAYGDAEDTAEFPPPTLEAHEILGLREGRRVSQVGPRGALPLEEEASTLVARYLFPTEKFRGEWRKHPIKLWKELVVVIGATLILGWATGWFGTHNQRSLTTFAVIVWILVLLFVGWRTLDWWYDRFILTNKRIMVVSGLVTRTVGMMPLVRVTDMKYEQSPLARLLNYGTFVVESAGQDQALRTVKPLPNPNELYLRIVEEMYEPEAVEARLSRVAEENTDI